MSQAKHRPQVRYDRSNNARRDLKPENILLETDGEDANLKVIDFGTATIFRRREHLKARYGTVTPHMGIAVALLRGT
ncbi:MAG: hypothetical protein P4M11_04745 [Candidatus Pacebacteria bacterium]|nr:hypothetical protein [Candidatus Paceibacterota bacterium]